MKENSYMQCWAESDIVCRWSSISVIDINADRLDFQLIHSRENNKCSYYTYVFAIQLNESENFRHQLRIVCP